MKAKLISYTGPDEILVCLPKEEPEVLKVYFGAASGRELEEYTRKEHFEPIEIAFRMEAR